jgi:hypothetical protein
VTLYLWQRVLKVGCEVGKHSLHRFGQSDEESPQNEMLLSRVRYVQGFKRYFAASSFPLICSSCKAPHSKWSGKCSSCNEVLSAKSGPWCTCLSFPCLGVGQSKNDLFHDQILIILSFLTSGTQLSKRPKNLRRLQFLRVPTS